MLRRGLVLDLSVAFGKLNLYRQSQTFWGETQKLWICLQFRRSRQLADCIPSGLGTTFGYLYWYGMFAEVANATYVLQMKRCLYYN